MESQQSWRNNACGCEWPRPHVREWGASVDVISPGSVNLCGEEEPPANNEMTLSLQMFSTSLTAIFLECWIGCSDRHRLRRRSLGEVDQVVRLSRLTLANRADAQPPCYADDDRRYNANSWILRTNQTSLKYGELREHGGWIYARKS